jgi:hypothetical protein
MSNKYIFIDDKIEMLQGIVDRLNSFNQVKIEAVSIKKFNDMIDYISDNIDNIDGIILDLRLDEAKIEGEKSTARYKAPALALELRTLAAETETGQRQLKGLPIVLCSTDGNIKAIYKNENASHGAFDIRFMKGDTDNFKVISKQLKCLIDGYKIITEKKGKIDGILSIEESYLDKNLISKFKDKTPLAHNLAQIILKDLIFSTGLLIDRNMLISKLGLDFEYSKDKDRLIDDIFENAKYTGVFSSGWERWWLPKIIEIFKEKTDVSLVQIDASSRVKKLKECTPYKQLVVAAPINKSFSNRFWTYCKGYKAELNEIRPLDPLEGFKIVQDRDHQSWHEYEYISFNALRHRYGKNKGIKLHSSEKERYRIMKEADNGGN